MSQQPRHGSASGPSRLVSENTSPAGTASSAQGSPTGRTSAAHYGTPRSEHPADRGLPLPRMRPQDVKQETIVTPGGTERPRALGVHSILNPPESSSPRGQRRTISEVDSPQDSQGSYFPRAPSSTRSRDSDVSPTSAAPAWDGPPRRILSPRSPSAHRSGSMGYIKPPTGTIDAQRSPFVPSASMPRSYTSEPGASGVPPLPSPALSQPHQPLHAPMPLNPLSRRPSLQQGQASASTSPSTAYSSISHPSTEPHYQYSTASSVQSRQPSVGPGPQSSIHPPPSSIPPRSHNPTPMGFNNPASAGSSTQSAYQLMTVETHHGPIQVPVDVQAASRVADEKRRRNAGASARFRQRRKQKELHANQTINRLEQQLRDAEEDAEFYRRERDLLRDVAWNTQDRERIFPRPQSPRHRRKPLPQVDPEDVSGDEGSNSGSQSRDTESQSGYVQANPTQRRRTSAFGMGPLPGESQAAGYAPGAPPMPGPSHQPHQPQQHQQYYAQPVPASYPPPQHHQAQPHPQHHQQHQQHQQHHSPHPHGSYPGPPSHQSQQPPPR